MDVPFWIGDREFNQADLDLIRLTVRRFSRFSREEITATLCENLPWKAPDGRLKKDVCRQLKRCFIRVQTSGGPQIVGLLLFVAAAKVLADREPRYP